MSRPLSLLFVCLGNTCRSPMAAAIAKQRWPGCKIRSAGISVLSEGQGASQHAVAAMHRRGIDIGAHKTTSLGSVDLQSFDCIVAMEPAVVKVLDEQVVDPPKVEEAFVADPIGGDATEYEACARAIEVKLDALVF